jgi:hypothetical protein
MLLQLRGSTNARPDLLRLADEYDDQAALLEKQLLAPDPQSTQK